MEKPTAERRKGKVMLHVNFDLPKIIQAGGFMETEQRHSNGRPYDMKVLHFGEIKLDVPDDGSSPYICRGSLNESIPKELEPFVLQLSYYENFGQGRSPKRQLGEYRHKTAVAELEEVGGKDVHYHLKLRAQRLDDLKTLNALIREGKIWPACDYEAVQVPPPYRHARELLRELWQILCRDVSDKLHSIRV